MISSTHRIFLSTGCSPNLKTWSGTKSTTYLRAFLTTQLHSCTSFLLWSYLGVVSTHSMPWLANLKSFLSWEFFSREWRARLHRAGWPPAYSQSCLLCCGSSWAASNTLECEYCSLLLCPVVKCKFIRLQGESLTRRLVQSGFLIHPGKADSLPPSWWQNLSSEKLAKYSPYSQMSLVWSPRTIFWLFNHGLM